ncbi:MAG: hypothetical protein ACREVM_09985, partial [Burkholderiales bacterium]
MDGRLPVACQVDTQVRLILFPVLAQNNAASRDIFLASPRGMCTSRVASATDKSLPFHIQRSEPPQETRHPEER